MTILQKLAKSKFVAFLILFSQIVYVLPAQAILQENNYGKMRLEQYLSWADRQKEAEDWERLAEEGVLAAMSEWESANAYLKETNYEEYIANKKEAYEEFESIKNIEYTYWYMNKRVQEESVLMRSELAQKLAEKSAEYKKQYAETGATKDESNKSEREWDEYASALVNQYMNNLMEADESLFPEISGKLKEQKLSEEELKSIYSVITGSYEQNVLKEYGRIYAAEKNQLMSVLLYDTKSTKMLSSAQAAEVIAKDTAKSVKDETDIAMNILFGDFEETIESADETDVQIKRQNWLNNFQKTFEESVQKWNDAEMEFLAKRSEWENQAAEVYEENERAWAEGYRLLQQKRTEWFKEIGQKLEKGRKEWDKSEKDLNEQLDKNYKELQATLEKERDSKEKNIDLYVSIYNQSRSMLNIVAAGLEGAGNSIIESYGKNYAYWKTEAAESLDSDKANKINELFDIFNKLKKNEKNRGEFFNDDNQIQKLISLINELSPACNDTKLKSELESLVASDGWLTYLVNYKAKTLDAVQKLYKLTGCIYKGDANDNDRNTDLVYFNELDYEIVKANITLEYWQEEYEVVRAVRQYAESLDSTTETDADTTQELLNKTALYEQAVAAYEKEVKALVSYKNSVDTAQKSVDEKKKILDEKKKALEEAKNKYSELLAVYRGVGTELVKNKLYSLIAEYNEKKAKDNDKEFEEYYTAVVEYNNENMKQKYYSAKNNIINGSDGLIPKARLENYKDEVNGFINSLDIDSDGSVSLIKNFANKIAQYRGDESYYIKKYLEDYSRIKEEKPDISEQKKAEYKSIISKYLQSVEKYFENEINQRNEALYYIEHGKFEKTVTVHTDSQKKEIELKNYLTAAVNAKKEWADNVKTDLSEYEALFAKVSELSGKSGNELINAVKEEIKNNDQFRLFIQQKDVFGSDLLTAWIKQEAGLLNKTVYNEEDNQTTIKGLYSQYAVNAVNENHAKTIEEIKNYLSDKNIKSLDSTKVYKVIEDLRGYEKNLNEYGIAALENYISSLIDVVATNEVNKKLLYSNIKTIEDERDRNVTELNDLNDKLSSLQVLANTGLSDIKTVLEKMEIESNQYVQNYAVYLMMAYLYQSDLEDCNNKDDVKAIFKKALDKVKAEAEESASIFTDETSKAEKINELVESSWYNSFDKLNDSIKDKLCQKIFDVYNFDKKADSYQKYVDAINDYFKSLNNSDEYTLNFEAGEQPEERKAIADANTFVRNYFALQDLLKRCDGQIEHLQEEIDSYNARIAELTPQIDALLKQINKLNGNTSKKTERDKLIAEKDKLVTEKSGAEKIVTALNKQIAEIEEQKTAATKAFKENLSEKAKDNNWYDFIKDYKEEDFIRLTMYFAGEDSFFIYLQSDYGISDFEKVKENLTEGHRIFIEKYLKRNEIVNQYCVLLDDAPDKWIEKLEENISDSEKEKIKGILEGTDFNYNYYNYKASKANILNSNGATQLINARGIEIKEILAEKIYDEYESLYKDITNKQFQINLLNAEIAAFNGEDTSWVKAVADNGVKSDDSMDEKTKKALKDWIDGTPDQNDKILNEKIAICDKHLNWLLTKSLQNNAESTGFTQQSGALKVYTDKMNQAYAKFISVKECSGIINEIQTANKSLKIAIEDQAAIKDKVAALSKEVKRVECELADAKNHWNTAVNELTSASNTYNQHVETADTLFTTLKIKEKEKRIAQEKKDYASSIYLKSLGEVSDENYVSPQEKEVIIQYSLERAQVNADVLNEIKNDNKKKYTQNKDYTDAMNEYKTFAENHFKAVLLKTETDRGLKIQEDLVRKLDAELQAVYQDTSGSGEVTSVKEKSLTAKYVRATYNSADKNYTFQLVIGGNAGTAGVLNTYFTEKAVAEDIPGGKRYITQAAKDSREWLLGLIKQGNESYIQDIMLAAIYVKYKNNEDILKDYQFTVDGVPSECQGIKCNRLIESYKETVIKDAYDSVMSRSSGEQDLIKYLMFNYDSKDNDNGIISNFFNPEYAKDAMQARDYAKVKVDIDSRYDGLIAESVAFGITAAEYAAVAACCGWPACLIPIAIAAGFTAASATAGVKAAKLKNDVSKAFENGYSTVRGNLESFASKNIERIQKIKEAKAALESEWLNLRIMYNGTSDGSKADVSETSVRTAMKKRCTILACNYDSMIDEIFTDKVLTDSKAVASEDVTQAIIDVNAWFETEETKKHTALDNVITNLKANQRDARAIYTASADNNAELKGSQKEKLHKLAVAASREDITAEEKAKAKKEFNDYKESLLVITAKKKNTEAYKNYKKDLKDLAIATYGNNTWSSDVYLKDLYSLWHDIYPTTLNYSVSTENYTASALADFKQTVLTQFDYAAEVKLRMLYDQQNKERRQLAAKRDAWEKQMAIIINIAEAEWDKAGESLVSGYNEWKTAFNKEFEEKDSQWYENYTCFLQKKQDWMDRQYLYAVNAANSNVIARSGLDAESEIAQALAGAEAAKLNFKPIDPEDYTEILIGESSLSKLMNSVESLQNRGKGAAVTRRHGYKVNTSSIKAQQAAEEMMLQIENDMKTASAKLAAEQAERMVQDSIKASMERIDNENENMRIWEENMVRRSGYTVEGKNIHREAVVDSTIGQTYYEPQSVHYYEDFYNAGPTISVSLSKTMLESLNSSGIMLLVEQANYEIENWSKQVFGNTEKDADGNVTLKQNVVVRDSDYKNEEEKYRELSKKKYEDLTEDEKNTLNGLSNVMISVRDGLLGDWTGYAPVFKDGNSGLDLSNSRESNIKYKGHGQMGKIMLDFQWNCMIEQQGWQKVALPAYDQPLWRGNGSWFEPPTIRGIAGIVFEAVGEVSGQKWFSYADDLIFAAIDLGGGFKSSEQVGLELAKTAATAAISMGCSAAGSAIGNVADASFTGAGKVLAKAGISAATSYATSVGTSFVNNWNFDANGNLAFDSESFGKSTYSAQTIAGSVGAGVTSGLTAAANMKMHKMGENGAAVNKFYGTAVNAGISAAGKLSEYAVYSSYALAEGRSLKDAYDDMGGLTFNIGSLGMFADMMASGIARNNATGQAGKFGEIAQKLSGTGILEINIGSNGIKGKFGTGGFDLAGSLYTFGKRMNDKAALEAYAMQEGASEKEAAAAYWGYVYGDWTQENTIARISNGTDELRIVDEMADGATAQTVRNKNGTGRVITMVDTGDKHQNAVQLGHEAYRDGVVRSDVEQQSETFNAVLGHAAMAARMDEYGTHFDGLLGAEVGAYQRGDMAALLMDSMYNYSSDADYWKLISRSDGTHELSDDGSRDLTIIYQDKNKEGEWEEVSRDLVEDKTGSYAASFANVIGFERAEEILGHKLNDISDFSDEAIASVTGYSEEYIDELKQNSPLVLDQIYSRCKEKLIGESLLMEADYSYSKKGGWNKDNANLENFQLTSTKKVNGYILFNQDESTGYIKDRFVVNAELTRNASSWDGVLMSGFNDESQYEDKSDQLHSQNRELDYVIYKKYDLKNNLIDSIGSEYPVQTVDVHNKKDYTYNKADASIEILPDGKEKKYVDRNQPFNSPELGKTVQGNTIVSDYSLQVVNLENATYSMIKHNAWTVNGNWINKNSEILDENGNVTPGGKWWVHGGTSNLTSDGCDIYRDEYHKEIQKKLKEWGVHSATWENGQIKYSQQIKGVIVQ